MLARYVLLSCVRPLVNPSVCPSVHHKSMIYDDGLDLTENLANKAIR